MGREALIRVGIVDDHPVFRLGLVRMFEREDDLEVRWELGTAAELLAALASNPVDVVLLDLNLGPDEDSLGTTRTILATWPDTKVIIISASVGTFFPTITLPMRDTFIRCL